MRKFKENKTKTMSFLSFILLMGLIFLAISSFYSYLILSSYNASGVELYHGFILFGGLTSIMSLFPAIMRIKAIFIGKDYDMLSSMPIKKRDIITSKLVSMYLTELIYSVLLLLPVTVLSFYYSKDATYLLGGLLLILFIPTFPLAIASILSIFLSFIADRSKYSNIISIIAYMTFFTIIMYFSMNLNNSSNNEADVANQFLSYSKYLQWINPTIVIFKHGFTSSSLYLLLFSAISFAIGAIVISFIALVFDKLHDAVTNVKANRVYRKKELKNEGQFKALLSNEVKRLFNSKMYFMNSISSVIACIICTLGLILSLNRQNVLSDPFVEKYAYAAGLLIIFVLGISNTASCAISIEGANFWMIKSLPIDYKVYIRTKFLVSAVLLLIGSLISSTIVVAIVDMNILSIITVYLMPILYSLFVSALSLIINLNFYKLKWKNESECVKRSSSVFIIMLIDFAISIGMIVIVVLTSMINTYVSMIVSLAVLAILAIVTYRILLNIVDAKINKIEEF